jgi:glucose-1-phosphate cytidylyltransferase
MDTAIGERLRRVRPSLEGDEYFLANYGDVLTDVSIDDLVDQFVQTDAVAQFIAVKPQDSFHVVETDGEGRVTELVPAGDMPFRVNGGYFVLRQAIFDYLDEGDDLVMDGCVKAARDGRTRAVPYDGFWAPMDTLKERTHLEDLYRQGCSPWTVWRSESSRGGAIPMSVDMPLPLTS